MLQGFNALSVFFPSPGEGLPFHAVTASETLSSIGNCSNNQEIFHFPVCVLNTFSYPMYNNILALRI